jgi:hypothetical protein
MIRNVWFVEHIFPFSSIFSSTGDSISAQHPQTATQLGLQSISSSPLAASSRSIPSTCTTSSPAICSRLHPTNSGPSHATPSSPSVLTQSVPHSTHEPAPTSQTSTQLISPTQSSLSPVYCINDSYKSSLSFHGHSSSRQHPQN